MRIRTIKPEWLEDERLAACSSDARVLSIALIVMADDAGRGRCGVVTAARVFPTDPSRYAAAVAELEGWYLDRYVVRAQTYYAIRNFDKHQIVDRRRFRVLTPDPSEGETLTITSKSTDCVAPAPPVSAFDARDLDLDLDLKSPNGLLSTSAKSTVPTALPVASVVRQIFDHWVTARGKDANRVKLTAGRKRKVEARLREGYTPEEIMAAIDNVQHSKFHNGDNEDGKVYDDLTLICRSGDKLEFFRDMQERSTSSDVVSRIERYEENRIASRYGEKRGGRWN